MKIRFLDGTVKDCSEPIEQKLFRSKVPYGWVMAFTLNSVSDSSEVDALFSDGNIEKLVLLKEVETEAGEVVTEEVTTISGYGKLSSIIIKHSEDGTKAEIQLTKTILEEGA
jgi:hypothetical protein